MTQIPIQYHVQRLYITAVIHSCIYKNERLSNVPKTVVKWVTHTGLDDRQQSLYNLYSIYKCRSRYISIVHYKVYRNILNKP